ncbi:phage DNA packaging protein J [Streptomyces chumphonensis]|uniref:Phage DNA packaging protein J n=1 Tax=Streptomyces chumphonensis TaxID=1214925 RepID=A0A927IBT8_9ACTN|nr:phage DNA packaging protein J [Streptomyces chumphonensis]
MAVDRRTHSLVSGPRPGRSGPFRTTAGQRTGARHRPFGGQRLARGYPIAGSCCSPRIHPTGLAAVTCPAPAGPGVAPARDRDRAVGSGVPADGWARRGDACADDDKSPAQRT